MTLRVGIVGAGIIGRLLAAKAQARGWDVTLYDRGDESAGTACSLAPPAMLAPYCELEPAASQIALWGAAGLAQWPHLLGEFGIDAFFQQQGSLIVAHPRDRGELSRFTRIVESRHGASMFRIVARDEIDGLEPEIDPAFGAGLYCPYEGQIDSRAVLSGLLKKLRRDGANLQFNRPVLSVRPYCVVTADGAEKFDLVFDCRGIGATDDLPDLRAVRGEIIRIHAPDVRLNRPIRLLHPRWPLYVVPRPNGHYIIGATEIESSDTSPISVRSIMELLSAAMALSSNFSEARILETNTGLRPAYPDNLPRLTHQPGLIQVNGLYRHGFLLAPVITDAACNLALQGEASSEHAGLIREAA